MSSKNVQWSMNSFVMQIAEFGFEPSKTLSELNSETYWAQFTHGKFIRCAKEIQHK